MKSLYLPLAFSLAIVLSGCQKTEQFLQKLVPPAAPEKHSVPAEPARLNTISGHVTDLLTSQSLIDAKVEVLDLASGQVVAWAHSESSGNFRISNLLDGNYAVQITKSGYTDFKVSNSPTTSGGHHWLINASLNQLMNNINGVVKDSHFLNGVANARVQLINADTDVVFQTTQTGWGGSYLISNVPIGNYKMYFSKDGYTDTALALPGSVGGGLNYAVNATLDPKKVIIQGQVSDIDTGLPLLGVQVVAISPNGGAAGFTYSDSAGKYNFPDLYTGNYNMRFVLAGYYDTNTNQPGDTIGGNSYTVNAAMSIKKNTIYGHVVEAI